MVLQVNKPDNVVYEPSYVLSPDVSEKFYPSKIKVIAQEVLSNELEGRLDKKCLEDWFEIPDNMESLTKDIANTIKMSVLEHLKLPRYKIIVQISLGQMKNQGVSISSRCMWEPSSDNYASVSFRDELVWASAIIFGIYTE